MLVLYIKSILPAKYYFLVKLLSIMPMQNVTFTQLPLVCNVTFNIFLNDLFIKWTLIHLISYFLVKKHIFFKSNNFQHSFNFHFNYFGYLVEISDLLVVRMSVTV